MINTALLDQYRLNELIQFMQNVGTHASNNDLTVLKLEGIKADFDAQLLSISEAYSGPGAHPLTKLIEESDARRDRIVQQINYKLLYESLQENEEVSEKALALLDRLNHYGGMALIRRNYNAQSADVQNLIADWQSLEEYAGYLADLGADADVARLQEENEKFIELFTQRSQDQGNKITDETAGLLRKPMIEVYKRLVTRIHSGADLNKDLDSPLPNFDLVINAINEEIRQFNQYVLDRNPENNSTNEAPSPNE